MSIDRYRECLGLMDAALTQGDDETVDALSEEMGLIWMIGLSEDERETLRAEAKKARAVVA